MNKSQGVVFVTVSYLLAFLFDSLQVGILLIPLAGLFVSSMLGPFIGVSAALFFIVWFGMNGINIFSGKVSVTKTLALIFELTPGIGVVTPGWTILVYNIVSENSRAMNQDR